MHLTQGAEPGPTLLGAHKSEGISRDPTRSGPRAESALASTTFVRGPRAANKSPQPAPRPPPVTHTACPMAATGVGPRGAGPEVPCAGACGVNAPLCPWREAKASELRPKAPGHRTVRMSASLVRATVRAVSKRKLQPTRAALTLVSGRCARPGP